MGNTVLGIDPGSRCAGWGIVEEDSGVLRLVACGAIRPKGEEFTERLASLFYGMQKVLEEHTPQEVSIENVFTAQNAASALKLGQARGVLIAACAARHIPVFSYTPTEVKKTLVGVGRAEKTQVAFMVAQMLNCKKALEAHPLDTSDALALAICHLNMRRFNRLVNLGK